MRKELALVLDRCIPLISDWLAPKWLSLYTPAVPSWGLCKNPEQASEEHVNYLQHDVDFAMLVLRPTLDIKWALVQAESVQFRQLLLPHCHILKLATVRQHRQDLQWTV